MLKAKPVQRTIKLAASRSKRVKFSYHDGFISESEGRASDDERLTAKGLTPYPSLLKF